MQQLSFLYEFSSLTITAGLFVMIVVVNEVGFRIGRDIRNRSDEEIKSLTGAIQASILGLLALLLSFTFSMSMQRYDDRSEVLISEANAIGTLQLRAQLIPEQFRDEVSGLLKAYVDLRVAVGTIDLSRQEDRRDYDARISEVQTQLWSVAVKVVEDDPRPVTSGVFLSALNDMIDAQGKRSALLQLYVPEIIIYLLFLVFVASGEILGYSSGLSGKRVVAPTLMVSLLIALIVFIIIDLDRPKRGLIQVNQTPMLMLQAHYEQHRLFGP